MNPTTKRRILAAPLLLIAHVTFGWMACWLVGGLPLMLLAGGKETGSAVSGIIMLVLFALPFYLGARWALARMSSSDPELSVRYIIPKRSRPQLVNSPLQQYTQQSKSNVAEDWPVEQPAYTQTPYPQYGTNNKSNKQDRSGYVYLIQSESGHYKIGRTKDINDRMHTFNVKLPMQYEPLHVITCVDCYQVEKELHQKFASKRINGEWFDLTGTDVAYIKSIKRA